MPSRVRASDSDSDSPRSRFVILRHQVGAALSRTGEAHLDWMFESGDALRTWASPLVVDFDQPLELECEALADHRLTYLDFEGQIDGDRGLVNQVLSGRFRLLENDSDRFEAELVWQQGPATRGAKLICYRSLPGEDSRVEDSCCWRLLFSPCR